MVRPLLLLTIVLAAPIVPFLLFGDALESRIEQWCAQERSAGWTAAAVFSVLAVDVFLPVPSSVVSTMGGWRLGVLAGSLTSWMGMNAGAVFGFWLARVGGRPIASYFSSPEDLDQMSRISEQTGPSILVLARPVPVLAEASVLWMGVCRMSWGRFLAPVVTSNLGIAVAYSAFGDLAKDHLWLPLALALSLGFPVLLWRFAQHRLRRVA